MPAATVAGPSDSISALVTRARCRRAGMTAVHFQSNEQAIDASDVLSVVNMGGEGTESQETRATEASVRGFWKAYRRCMGL